MRLLSALFCVLAYWLSTDAWGGEAMCDIARSSAAYSGKTVVVHGDMFVGMHGSALFNHECFETPMPIRLDANSQAQRDFNKLYDTRDDGRRIEAKGVLRLEGDRYYLEVESVSRAEVQPSRP